METGEDHTHGNTEVGSNVDTELSRQTLEYARTDPQLPPPPAGNGTLIAAIVLCIPVVLTAWLIGLDNERPDLGLVYFAVGAMMLVAAPCVLASIICWLIGVIRMVVTRHGWGTKLRKGIILAIVPFVLAGLSYILTTGIAAPAMPPPPGVEDAKFDATAWNSVVDKVKRDGVRAVHVYDGPPLVINGVEVQNITLDDAGGIWFETRRTDAGWMWDYWFEGVVYQPGPGLDPIGNQGLLELEPIGNGWYRFRTRWTD